MALTFRLLLVTALVALPLLVDGLITSFGGRQSRLVVTTSSIRKKRKLEGRKNTAAADNTVDDGADAAGNVVVIRFCQGCNWMLRATWMTQELLSSFSQGEIAEIRLQPQYAAPGGDFIIRVNDEVVWDRRAEDPGFPQPKELKRRVRDAIAPDMSLGHNDR